MAKAKKKEALSLEEKLEQALVPANEQLYEVPENWCWTYLTSGFCECKDSFRKPINASGRAEREGDIPYYGATGQVGWIDDYLTDEQLVLVGEDGAPFLDTIKDKAYMIEGKAWVNNHAHILKSYYGEVGNKFILNYLNSFNYKGYVNGTTRLKLTQASMNTIPVPMPPLAEQKRIVEQIENMFAKLDEAKEKAYEIVDKFESVERAIQYEAFTGKLTKNWRLTNSRNEDTWIEKTLQDVCCMKITDGTHKTPIYCEKEDGGIPFISAKDVTTKKICWDNIKYIVPELHDELYARLAPQMDDVLLAKNGTTGVAAIVEEDKVFDLYVTLAVLRPDKSIINPRYLLNIVNSPVCKMQFDEHLTGIGVPNLHLRDIKDVKIQLPLLDEQEEIVRIVELLLEKEKKAFEIAKTTIDSIEMMKKTILAKAFRGELGTYNPDEESAVELLKSILATE